MARTSRRNKRSNAAGSIRKLSSGRFQARYLDPIGQRRTAPTTFATRRDAEQWLAAMRTDIHRGAWRDPEAGRITLAAFATKWMQAPPRPLRESTRSLYQRLIRLYLLQPVGGITLGDLNLSALSPTIIREWHAQLQPHIASQITVSRPRTSHPARVWAAAQGIDVPATGRLPEHVADAWKQAGCPIPIYPARTKVRNIKGGTTASQTYRLVRAILNTALDEGLIDANPCRIKGTGRSGKSESKPATIDELQQLVAIVPERYRAAVLVAAWSGLRAGEQFGLARRHVDLNTGRITVERQLVEVIGQPLRFGEPKTEASMRTVTLPTSITAVLAEHMERFTGADSDALIFTTSEGNPVTRRARANWWIRARARIGRPDLRWHDLRHTGQTFAAATGAGLPQLMQRMGHSTARAALGYMHTAEDGDRLLADRLESVLRGDAQIISIRDARSRRIS